MLSLEQLAEDVIHEINSKGFSQKRIGFSTVAAYTLDGSRVATRTIITMETEKIFPFPSFNEIFPIALEETIRKRSSLTIVKVADAEVKVELLGHYGYAGDAANLSTVLSPSFYPKKTKRKRGLLKDVTN